MTRNLFRLLFCITLFLPMASYGKSDTDLELSVTIKKLKELKPDNIELKQIVIEDDLVKIEGYASDSISVSDYFNSIEEGKIGKLKDDETQTIKRSDGQYVIYFYAYVEPAYAEDLHPFVSMSDTGQAAWWFGTEFHPFGQFIRGLPIKEIDSKWCTANEFKKELFPKTLLRGKSGLNEILKDGRSFSVTGKFDGIHKLTALVGIYETCEQETGTFLLLLNTKKRSKPVVFLKEYDKQFFAYLIPLPNNRIVLADCYGCDTTAIFTWTGSEFGEHIALKGASVCLNPDSEIYSSANGNSKLLYKTSKHEPATVLSVGLRQGEYFWHQVQLDNGYIGFALNNVFNFEPGLCQ